LASLTGRILRLRSWFRWKKLKAIPPPQSRFRPHPPRPCAFPKRPTT
jgi:hypothetical protein